MSEHDNQYEEVQRYHVYNVGGEDTYCRDEDVAELEAVHCKLLEAHKIMERALISYAALECMHMSKTCLAGETLQRVAEVML